MLTAKEKLKEVIRGAVSCSEDFQILEPEVDKFGDYSTNVAFILAKREKKSPKEIAKRIKEKLNKKQDIFEKIKIAKSGFINLFLNKKWLHKKLEVILQEKENYGKIKREKPLKVQVEFISANPTGPLHLGHGRNAFYGDVLARTLKYAGNNIQREFYVNDARRSTQVKELGKTVLGRGSQYKSVYLEKKTQKLEKELKTINDENEAGYFMVHEILTDIEKTVDKLGIKFDKWFSEQNLYNNNAKENLLKEFDKKRLVYKKDGALWLKTSQYGDDKDRVIIRSSGDTTYFFSDILYHKNKIKRGFKKIIDIWGADHQGHEKKMQALMKILKFKGNLEIPIIQMVRLKTNEGPQKMSKRAGTAVDLEWLIKEVGRDVVRFMMVSKDISTQMVFDLEAAKEKSEKNPVYYLQYALVRCYSILRNSKIKTQKSKIGYDLLKEKEELGLIKQLIKFPDLIKEVAQNYEVHRLTTYGINLAKKLHQFYKNCQVIDEENKQLTIARLELIKATEIVFENLFDVLGIEKLEKM
ncbi:arginine--tRNA ligase [bacterium]|nr:MAG: arginine--tRNA ligase [bacterium]